MTDTVFVHISQVCAGGLTQERAFEKTNKIFQKGHLLGILMDHESIKNSLHENSNFFCKNELLYIINNLSVVLEIILANFLIV